MNLEHTNHVPKAVILLLLNQCMLFLLLCVCFVLGYCTVLWFLVPFPVGRRLPGALVALCSGRLSYFLAISTVSWYASPGHIILLCSDSNIFMETRSSPYKFALSISITFGSKQ